MAGEKQMTSEINGNRMFIFLMFVQIKFSRVHSAAKMADVFLRIATVPTFVSGQGGPVFVHFTALIALDTI